MKPIAARPPARRILPPAILPITMALFLLVGIGQNSSLALLSMSSLMIGSALLWRPGEAPILLFVFGYQWLQASARIFHANAKGVDVDILSYAGGQVAHAIILSLLALLALGFGLRQGAGPWRAQDGQLCRSVALRHNIPTWFWLYIVASIGGLSALILAKLVPGLSQPLIAVATMKWAFFWMLAYATFARPTGGRAHLFIAFGFETLLGVGGYFSDFKTVFFITILALVASGARLTAQRIFAIAVLSTVLIVMGVLWTAVKREYRSHVSGGEQAQVVNLTVSERLPYLMGQVAALEADDLVHAADMLVDRIGYVDFFAVVLDMVPAMIPHENGTLWWDAISRPFMPRILFPEKTAIHDSERTNFYTGLGVASFDSGTSISIGYVAESYIDFGEIGMLIVIFLYGLFLGRCYRWFLQSTRSMGLVGMALITSILIGTAAMESSITKVIGGVIVSILVSWTLVRYVVPTLVPWLRASPVR